MLILIKMLSKLKKKHLAPTTTSTEM